MPAKKGNKEKKVYYSPEEWAEVLKKASAMKVRPGTYIRRISVHGELKFYDLKELNQVKKAFRMIGTELNQIAKVANSTNSVTTKDVEEMQKQFKALKTILENHLEEIQPKVL